MNISNTIIFIDTEWGYINNRVGCESAYVPVVMCAFVLSSGQEYVFLPGRDNQRLADFLTQNKDALWVAHSATAEMKYIQRLGMPVPDKWYDTLLAERYLVNSSLRPEVGLTKTLERHNLGHLIPLDKNEIRQKILNFDLDPDNSREMDGIVEYCMQDCRVCAALFQRQRINSEDSHRLDDLMSWWNKYLLVVGKMELRGIPIDTETCGMILNNRQKLQVLLAKEINTLIPVMTISGINREKFRRFCKATQIPLPRAYDKKSRKMRFSIENEALKEIEHYHPLIPKIREAHKTLLALRNNKMIMDFDSGCHYFDLNPFGTITGRNNPKQFIFNLAKWMRFLIVPEDLDHVLVYVDYSGQEIGIAATLSHDSTMKRMYQAEDPHMAFAKLAKAVPENAKKSDYPEVRKKYKAVNFGVLYRQTPDGSARQLGISIKEAKELHNAHHRLFPTFWDWSERKVITAINRGSIRTRLGWRSWVPPESNERTLANWPMQATGADIMRLTIMYMDKVGLTLLAPIHDGFLLSCHRRELPHLQRLVDFACESAVEHVLPNFKLRWTVTIYEKRFEDPDGLPLWETVQRLLRSIVT